MDPDRSVQREQRTVDTSDGTHPADAWKLSDVEAFSTDEIVEKLADHSIETNETAFRNRAEALDSATTLSDQ